MPQAHPRRPARFRQICPRRATRTQSNGPLCRVGRRTDCDGRQDQGGFPPPGKQTHPDAEVPANWGGVGFIQVKAAYDVLGDPEARQRYDLSLQIVELGETLRRLEAQHRAKTPAWKPGESIKDWNDCDVSMLVKAKPKTPLSTRPRSTAKLWPLLKQLCGIRQRRRLPRRAI